MGKSMSEHNGIPKYPLLGVNVTALDLRRAADEVNRWIDEGLRRYVCVTGVHGVMECQQDEEPGMGDREHLSPPSW